ncbi:MAG: hypothetical protein ABSG59_19940 [Verrucomicrobiota bacterium]
MLLADYGRRSIFTKNQPCWSQGNKRKKTVAMSIPRHRCRLAIFADYRQFYVWDPEGSGRQAPVDWSVQDVANRAKIMPGVVVICPVRDMTVPVEVGIWDSEPQAIFGAWQHVVEAPLATGGLIEIHECTGGAHACFRVEQGDYTVRALYRGLDKLSEDGLKGEDFYEIQIWKAPCASLRVIRRWE